jgi:hypothetical protein
VFFQLLLDVRVSAKIEDNHQVALLGPVQCCIERLAFGLEMPDLFFASAAFQ